MQFTSEANQKWEEINKLAAQYPFPISYAFKRIQDPNIVSPYAAAVYTGCSILRYVAYILLADFKRSLKGVVKSQENAKQLEGVLKSIRSHITEGRWLGIIREFLIAYTLSPKLLFVEDFSDLSPDNENLGPLNLFIEARNGWAHYGANMTIEDQNRKIMDLLEIIDNMMKIFAFLREYPLVYVEDIKDKSVQIKKCMGDTLPQDQESCIIGIKNNSSLSTSGFYLHHRRDKNRFLQLDPFTIYYDQNNPHDFLSFDQYKKDNIAIYFTSILSGTVEIKSTIEKLEMFCLEFENALQGKYLSAIQQNTSGQASIPSESAEDRGGTGNWNGFKDYLNAIDESYRKRIAEKYDEHTYLRRQEVMNEYQQFLDSDKKFLVITGNAGTGKSSLLVHIDTETQSDPDVATLFIHAASIDKNKLEDGPEGFLKYLQTYFDRGGEQALWSKFLGPRSPFKRSEKFVIFIDAINENQDAQRLFKTVHDGAIDMFLRRRPWIKFVITSRVHAWQRIRHNNSLNISPELFYVPSRSKNKDLLAVELKGFEEASECQKAYELYRAHYNLKTPFEELSTEVRKLIQDPLFLSLLAQSSRNGEILPHLSKAEVYTKYEDYLTNDNQLHEPDLDFLKYVVELLLKNNSNKLEWCSIANNESALQEKNVVDRLKKWLNLEGTANPSCSLGELFLDPGFNYCFKRLTNCGILNEDYNDRYEFSVSFRYERFYDHHMGQYLYESIQTNDPVFRAQVYAKWVKKIHSGMVYLWGPLLVALGEEIRNKDIEVLMNLTASANVDIKDALVAALVTHSENWSKGKKVVKQVLNSLVDRETDWNWSDAIPSLSKVDESTYSIEERKIMFFRMLAETADRLDLVDELILLMTKKNEDVRLQSMRHAFEAWMRAYEKGDLGILQKLLDRLCDKISAEGKWSLPSIPVLMATFEFTGMIMMVNTSDTQVRRVLWDAWRDKILRKYLFSDANDSVFRKLLKVLVRTLGALSLEKMVIRRFKTASPNVVTNFREFSSFFPSEKEKPLAHEDRILVKQLVPYLNPDRTSLNCRSDRELIIKGLCVEDCIIGSISGGILSVHGARNPQVLVDFMSEFDAIFDDIIKPETNPELSSAQVKARMHQEFYLACDKYTSRELSKNPDADLAKLIPDSWLELLSDLSIESLETDCGLHSTRIGKHYREDHKRDDKERYSYMYGAFPLHWYVSLYTRKYGDVDKIPIFSQAMQNALKQKDVFKLRSLIGSIGVFRADLKHFRALLKEVRPFLSESCGGIKIPDYLVSKCMCKRWEERRKEVEEEGCTLRCWLISNLGNIRSRYPEEVDDFLDECDADQETCQRVATAQRPPSIGDVFAKIDWFITDALDQVKPIRRMIISSYGEAQEAKTLKQWLRRARAKLFQGISKACKPEIKE